MDTLLAQGTTVCSHSTASAIAANTIARAVLLHMPPRQLQFSPVERSFTATIELLELVGLDKKGELYRQRLYVSMCTLLSHRSPPHHTRPCTGSSSRPDCC